MAVQDRLNDILQSQSMPDNLIAPGQPGKTHPMNKTDGLGEIAAQRLHLTANKSR